MKNAHGRILQHVRDDEKADHATANVHLIKLGHATITPCNGDIPQRDI